MKKYELIDESIIFESRKLYRIRALIDIPSIGVKAGDLGGWVQTEYNLSHLGDCWIFNSAKAMDRSQVRGNSCMRDNSCLIKNGSLNGDMVLFDNLVLDQPVHAFKFIDWEYNKKKNKQGELVLTAGIVKNKE